MLKNYRLEQLDHTLKDKEDRFTIELKNLNTLTEKLPSERKKYHIERLADVHTKFSQEKRESMSGSITFKKSTVTMVDAYSMQLKTMRKDIIHDILKPYEDAIVKAELDLQEQKKQVNKVLTTNLVRKVTLRRKKDTALDVEE